MASASTCRDRRLEQWCQVSNGRSCRVWRSLVQQEAVIAYHSSNPSDPDVYHESDTCPTGQLIPASNRVSGKGEGNRPCKQCAS